jgi:ubiquinone/menaquinone biosynthesis C-methylase UbiE
MDRGPTQVNIVSEQPPSELDPTIAEFYHRAPEEHRLEQGPFVLEEARTRELIERHARLPPATVLDVGGAAGAYAVWLADAGYMVHLVDPVARLVAEAQRRSATLPRPLASCRVGEARALDFPAESADMVLLLGPLYHLTEAADRARALSEARRVLKPGGRLFAAAISRWASALDGLSRDLFQDPRFAAIVEQDLREGQHRNPTERLDYFTTAYFHRPDEFRAEVLGAGLVLEGLYGVEGPGWLFSDVTARLADPHRRADLLQVARQLESEPSLLGVSAHLLVVARTPA